MPRKYELNGHKFIRCRCGVIRLPDLPCWFHEDRAQTFREAEAELHFGRKSGWVTKLLRR